MIKLCKGQKEEDHEGWLSVVSSVSPSWLSSCLTLFPAFIISESTFWVRPFISTNHQNTHININTDACRKNDCIFANKLKMALNLGSICNLGYFFVLILF